MSRHGTRLGLALCAVALLVPAGTALAQGTGTTKVTTPQGPGQNEGGGTVPLAVTRANWTATFPVELKHVALESTGVYAGGAVPINLDSLGGNMMEPNRTGTWVVVPNPSSPARGQMIFKDPEPGLKMPGPNEVPQRLRGTLAALASVNRVFTNTRMVATVNTTGGPEGRGSVSRQGPVVRWNGSTQFLACFVDFAAGTSYLYAGRSAYEYEPLGNAVRIPNFAATRPYRVELTMVGPTARCRVYDGTRMVADTGDFKDTKTPPKGTTGVLFEISPHKPEAPLEGSFTEAAATSI